MDIALTRPLEEMSVEELCEPFREKYAAMVTASPKLIEHVLETEQREQQLTLLADEGPSPIAPAASNEASSDVETFAAVRPRGRLRHDDPFAPLCRRLSDRLRNPP